MPAGAQGRAGSCCMHAGGGSRDHEITRLESGFSIIPPLYFVPASALLRMSWRCHTAVCATEVLPPMDRGARLAQARESAKSRWRRRGRRLRRRRRGRRRRLSVVERCPLDVVWATKGRGRGGTTAVASKARPRPPRGIGARWHGARFTSHLVTLGADRRDGELVMPLDPHDTLGGHGDGLSPARATRCHAASMPTSSAGCSSRGTPASRHTELVTDSNQLSTATLSGVPRQAVRDPGPARATRAERAVACTRDGVAYALVAISRRSPTPPSPYSTLAMHV
jgi:hypothetical protein